MKFLVFLISFFVSGLILKYRRPIREFFGDIAFAEKIFGVGGTNTFVVVFGILVFLLGLFYMTGTLESLLQAVLGPFFLS